MSVAAVHETAHPIEHAYDLDAFVEQIVDGFPPLCDSQKHTLAKLLSPASR